MKIDTVVIMALVEKWENLPFERCRNSNATPEERENYAVQDGEFNGYKKAAKDVRALLDLLSN